MGGTKKRVTMVTKDGGTPGAKTPAGEDAEPLGEEIEEEWEEEWEEEEDAEQEGVEEIDEVAEMKRQQQQAL